MSDEEFKYSIIENFISESECDHILDIVKALPETAIAPWESHKQVQLIWVGKPNEVVIHPTLKNDIVVNNTLKKIIEVVENKIIEDYFLPIVPDYAHVNIFETGTKFTQHLDRAHQPWSTVLYLNDDFDGGQTVIGYDWIEPKKGTLVAFQGNKIPHRVRVVSNGTRYTISQWFRIGG